MATSKVQNDKTFKFQIVNIKLQTNKQGLEKEEAYLSLIKKLKTKKVHSSVAENIHMIIYSAYERVTSISNTKYIYGQLGKGIYFEKELINSLNIEESRDEKQQANNNQILEPKIADYIFIPKIHKFIFINSAGISINNIHKFLKESLPKVSDKEDILEIEIVKDPKITDEILNAFEIHSLDYTISYTNDDPTSSVEKLLDDRLKKLYAGKMTVQLEADNRGHLNMEEPDELIEGGVKLAEQNGQINQAVITKKSGGKKVKVSNKENPRYFDVMATVDDYKELIIGKVLSIFQSRS
jgi:hypothetical protein